MLQKSPNFEVSQTILALRDMQSQRVNLIKAELRLCNQQGALVRRALGYHWELPEKEQTKIKNQSAKITATFNKDGEGAPEGLEMVMGAYRSALIPLQAQRSELDKSMEKLAKQLPATTVDFALSVKGFGLLALAKLVGEAGDFSDYANPAKIWKRFGLAVLDGKRQGNPGKDAKEADWIEHGYSGRRRSVVWNVGETIIKAQIRNVKDANGERTDQSTSIGPYGALYLDRKAYELPRVEGKKAHAHNRAKRFMEKRLLADLWEEWNEI